VEREVVIKEFNKLWHESIDGTWHQTRWLGVKVIKNPMDLFVYQELISRIRPSLIVETGTCFGGSALFLATICDAVNHGVVLSIDLNPPRTSIKHDRIHFYQANSISPEALKTTEIWARSHRGPVIVILDSCHKKEHVLKELKLYNGFVKKGSYIIVEDTNLGGDVRKDFGPGPREAVDEFLQHNNRFVIDTSCERYYATFNPGGYLKCVR